MERKNVYSRVQSSDGFHEVDHVDLLALSSMQLGLVVQGLQDRFCILLNDTVGTPEATSLEPGSKLLEAKNILDLLDLITVAHPRSAVAD